MYPTGELREAWKAAKADGVRLGPVGDPLNVAILERRGYLPRDLDRVRRLVAEATAAAVASQERARREQRAARARARAKRRPRLRVVA